MGSYLVVKSFGGALNCYINEWTLTAKIEYNAITEAPVLSFWLVMMSFLLSVISSIAQLISLRNSKNERIKLDEEFGYKIASEA